MKRLVVFALLLWSGIVSCNAQYQSNNSYAQAAYWANAVAESNEAKMLDNIRFNYNEIKQNPDALSRYNEYLRLNLETLESYNTFTTIGLVGLGIFGASLIPMAKSLSYDYDDPRYDSSMQWGIGLMLASCVPMLIGYGGMVVCEDELKINKKELIYYLKAYHNGLGVVALF